MNLDAEIGDQSTTRQVDKVPKTPSGVQNDMFVQSTNRKEQKKRNESDKKGATQQKSL